MSPPILRLCILAAITIGVFAVASFGIWRAEDKTQAEPYLSLLTLTVVAWLTPERGNG